MLYDHTEVVVMVGKHLVHAGKNTPESKSTHVQFPPKTPTRKTLYI